MALNRDKILKGAEKFVQKGKIDNAIREYEKLLKLNPNDVNTINRVGDLYNRIGQVDRAVELYERIANAFAADGFASKAIAIFKKINRLAPDRVEIFERLADLYIQQGLVIEARAQFQMLADWFLKNDDVENGIQTMRKLVQVDPENHMAHLRLADLLFKRGDSEEAIGVYERLGGMLLGRGKVDEAERLFRHALEQDPPTGEFLAPMCEALVDSGNVATAREFLIQAQKRSADSPQLQIIGLRVALATGDTQEALDAAERVLAEHGDHPDAPGLAGRAYLAGGEHEKGKQILIPAARAMLDRGSQAGARAIFRELHKSLPEDREVLSLGITALSTTDDKEMIVELRSALADSYFQAGEMDQARRLYVELKRQDPANELFSERLREAEHGEAGPSDLDEEAGPASAEAAPPAPEAVEPHAEAEEQAVEQESDVIEFEIPDGLAEEPADQQADGDAAQRDQAQPGAGADPGFLPEERLAEANVFAKYGLLDKAIAHLESILVAFPDDRAAREKIVQLAVEAGRGAYAIEQAEPLFDAYRATGDEDSIAALSSMLPEVEQGAMQMPGEVSGESAVVVDDAGPAEKPTAAVAADDVAAEMPPAGVAEDGPGVDAEGGAAPEEPDEASDELFFDDEVDDDLDLFDSEPSGGGEQWPPEVEAVDEPADVEAIEFEQVELEPRTLPEMETGTGLEFEAVAMSDFEPQEEKRPAEEPPVEDVGETIPFDSEPGPEPAAESTDRGLGAAESPVMRGGILSELEELERAVAGPQRASAPPAAQAVDAVAAETPQEIEAEVPPEDGPDALQPDLERLDSFIDNSLYEDAARILMRLEGDFPDDSRVSQRRAVLKSKGFLMDAVAAPMEESEDLFADEADEYVDLAAELEEEMAAEEAMVQEAVGSQDGQAELEEVFREFQKGVAEQLSEEDSDTHFNLGIAYKEMGLLPEAIREFQVSSRDPKFFVECCSMIGVCYVEQGLWEQGAAWYAKALSAPDLAAESQTALKYDLADALEGAGDVDRAIELFQEVSSANPSFRDVSVRLSDLGGEQYAN